MEKTSHYMVLTPKILSPLRRCPILWQNMALLHPLSKLGSFRSFKDVVFLFMGEGEEKKEL